jgi:hypothetical protein
MVDSDARGNERLALLYLKRVLISERYRRQRGQQESVDAFALARSLLLWTLADIGYRTGVSGGFSLSREIACYWVE